MQHIKRMAIGSGLLMFLAVALLLPHPSYAQLNNTTTNTTTAVTQDVCTNFTDRAVLYDANTAPSNGLLTTIYSFIKTTVNDATQKLFTAFVTSDSYKLALGASITLMVLFYGIGFTIGIVQPSFQQVLIRLVKISIITSLLAPSGGWALFNQYVVTFFQDGTDQIIVGVQSIGFGVQAPAGASPFYAIDKMAEFMIQPDTLVSMLGAILNGGVYGLTMGALMGFAMFGFFKLIIDALQVYAISFVARALILGVAPIFLILLFFDKTKNMFVAWLNALLNLSLQPILLFTFLSFFLLLMHDASKNMLNAELCWHEVASAEGSSGKLSFWTFVDATTKQPITQGGWNGSLECLINQDAVGANGKKCDPFPVNIINLLSFLLLVYLATRFTDVVKRISNELSNAFVSLDTQGKFDLDQLNNKANNALNNANQPEGGQQKQSGGNKPNPMGNQRKNP